MLWFEIISLLLTFPFFAISYVHSKGKAQGSVSRNMLRYVHGSRLL